MTLVDTSVWVEHFHLTDAALMAELEAGTVLVHPLVIGELACGVIRNRREVLALLAELPYAPSVGHTEVLAFLDARSLMGRGLGYVDVNLLASATLLPGTRLWTRDKRLASVAADLGLAWER